MPNQQKGTQDQIEVGKHIREARLKMKLTQEELAELVGIDKNTVYRYETAQGGNMSIDTFFRFATALEKTPNELAPSRFSKEDPEVFALVQEIAQQHDKKSLANLIQILESLSNLST